MSLVICQRNITKNTINYLFVVNGDFDIAGICRSGKPTKRDIMGNWKYIGNKIHSLNGIFDAMIHNSLRTSENPKNSGKYNRIIELLNEIKNDIEDFGSMFDD